MLKYFEHYWLVKLNRWHILLLILISGYVIRAIPSWLYWAWGNDFGIYYGLCLRILEYKTIFPPYDGWGASYNYFPILYLITIFLYLITNFDIAFLLKSIAPIVGALNILAFYFLVKKLTKNIKISLISSAILAFNPFHAYQTSHAAPLTLGHLFLIISLFLFITKNKGKWHYILLIFSSILLVMSHHLSTAIYIAIIFGIIFFRFLKGDKKDFNKNMTYFIFLTAFTFLYWSLLAKPVFYDLIFPILHFPLIIFIASFYLAIFLPFMIAHFLKIRYKPSLFSRKTEKKIAISTFLFLIFFTIAFSLYDFGLGFNFNLSSVLFLAPTYAILCLATIGWNRIKLEDYDAEIKGMLIPLILFLLFLLVKRYILTPRCIEYLIYPLSILATVGFLTALHQYKINTKIKKIAFPLFASLLFLSGVTTYEIQEATLAFSEKIPYEVCEAIEYLKALNVNSTIASDHRISTLLWAYGFNATYHYAFHLWFSENWSSPSCLRELFGQGCGGNFSKIGYVVIDSVMLRDGVQLFPNGTSNIMNASSFNKFNHEPFELVFEATSDEKLMSNEEWDEALKTRKYADKYPFIGSLDKPLPNAKEWCRIYKVNWTYIEENLQ